MGKDRKKQSTWIVFLRAELTALVLYTTGICLLALLAVKGVLPEQGAFPVTAIFCVLASFVAGSMVVRNAPLGRLPAALIAAALFAMALFLIGMCAWQEISWSGRGGILLLCVLGGGSLAALSGTRKRKVGKRARKK